MSTKPAAFDKADASALFDDRGYSGQTLRGLNPAHLLEKGLRERIIDSYYWKESCFALSAATLCDRAVELNYVGSTTGITGKPTPFICLMLKLLSLTPSKGIILEMLNFPEDEDEDDEAPSDDGDKHANGSPNGAATPLSDPNATGKLGAFKYLRVLAAFYIRLAWEPVDIYTTLEPLLLDKRKIRRRGRDGFSLTYVDQIVDDLLTKPRMFGTSLWKLPERSVLEDLDMLESRESPLAGELDAMDEDEESRREYESRSRSRSRSRGSSWSRSRRRDRSWTRSRSRSRSPSRNRDNDSRSRSRSRSRDYRRRTRSVDSRDDR